MRYASLSLAVLLVAIGIAMLVETSLLQGAGFKTGYMFGTLFVLAGCCRIWLARKGRG